MSRHFTWCSVVLLVLSVVVTGQDAIDPSKQKVVSPYRVDVKYMVQTTMKVGLSSESSSQPASQVTHIELTSVIEVKSAEDGKLALTVKTAKCKGAMTIGGDKIVFDSEKKDDLKDESKANFREFLREQTFLLDINDFSVITATKGNATLFQDIIANSVAYIPSVAELKEGKWKVNRAENGRMGIADKMIEDAVCNIETKDNKRLVVRFDGKGTYDGLGFKNIGIVAFNVSSQLLEQVDFKFEIVSGKGGRMSWEFQSQFAEVKANPSAENDSIRAESQPTSQPKTGEGSQK